MHERDVRFHWLSKGRNRQHEQTQTRRSSRHTAQICTSNAHVLGPVIDAQHFHVGQSIRCIQATISNQQHTRVIHPLVSRLQRP